MQKVDIHVHTRAYKGITRMGADTTYASPEELIDMYRHLNVSKGVILPGGAVECSIQLQSNEEVMAIVEKYPENFDWFCNIHPRMGGNSPDYDLSYFIAYYKERGAKGLGEVTANFYFDDPFAQNLFFHCQRQQMPIIFHVAPKMGGYYGLVDELGLPRLESMLAKFPDLIFIGHSQPFWAEIGDNVTEENRNGYPKGDGFGEGRIVELMRRYPNLHADLSAGSGYNAVTKDPEFGYDFLEEFSDRLYFGTDICAPENKGAEFLNLSSWLDNARDRGKISQKAHERISYKNAKENIGIEIPNL
ncbi:MAG: amidohydrolase family protein [Clostridiales bacterium]|nr:amidohydrolase family protein [Clostridiales bacterium]